MLSILEVHPRYPDVPTEPVRRAAQRLKEAAEAELPRIEQKLKENSTRFKYYASLGMPILNNAPEMVTFSVFKDKVTEKIKSVQGGLKGPAIDACNMLDEWARRAEAAGYPLGSSAVQEALAYFLLAVATAGFIGKDTTGTQMGNFQGEWRGGGFGSK